MDLRPIFINNFTMKNMKYSLLIALMIVSLKIQAAGTVSVCMVCYTDSH